MEEPTESREIEKDLVGVLFPGIVENDEKAIQCLGGIRAVSQVHSNHQKKRLGVNFQPDNPFMKKAYADSRQTTGVLIKVKVKKTRVGDEMKREVVSTSVIGRVKRMHQFNSMCDFQYLPVHKESGSDQSQCVIDQIIPAGMEECSFMMQPAPHHIVPQNFTRSDKPSNYAYTDKRSITAKETQTPTNSPPRDEDDIHKRTRSLRTRPVSVVVFNLADDLPTEPHEDLLKRKDERAQFYPNIYKDLEIVKKMFEERPIWSMNMIRYVSKIKFTNAKIILPCIGFYFKNGPWRLLWVRYGYDPRQEPGARIYQTLDFRLRHQAGIHSMVMTRDQGDSYKKSERVWRPTRDGQESASEEISEGVVIFRPGMAPAQRQIFYQYCDVKLPEVEQLIAAEPPPGSLCHPKRGWLQPNIDQVCRDHIFRYVKQTLLATHSADLKLEQGSDVSDEESNIEESNVGDENISSDEAASNT